MRFLADENISRSMVERIRDMGHVVDLVASSHQGAMDSVVLRMSTDDNEVLLTEDKDFGELVFRQRQATTGVILIRLHGWPRDRKAELVMSTIAAYGPALVGSFTVIGTDRVRIRSGPAAR